MKTRMRDFLARSRPGSVAVEAAVVIPLLVVLVMGVIDFGRLFYSQLVVQQAANESARALSLGQSSTAAGQIVTSVLGGVPGFANPSAGVATPTVTVVASCPATGTTPTPTGASSLTNISVGISFEWLTPLGILNTGATPALPASVSAHGKAVCRR